MEDIQIMCPCCNKRLADIDPKITGNSIVKLKCGRCKSVIALSIHRKGIDTDQLSEPKDTWKTDIINNGLHI